MRVNAVTNANSVKFGVKKRLLKNKLNENPNVSEAVAFKGGKGAAIGAGAGLTWLGTAAIASGPLLPLTLGMVAAVAGVGALAGHNIEEDFKENKE